MATEQDIQKGITDYLTKTLKAYSVKTIVGNRSGISDITACLPPDGKYFSCEVKKPGEAPRALQQYHLDQVIKAGGLAMSATSVEQVKQYLASNGYGTYTQNI